LDRGEAMADAPRVPKAVAGLRTVDKSVEKLAVDVHAISEKARTDRDMDKWQRAYADVLVTCAACHRALGAKPTARR
jgi:cytochrome c556